MKEKDPLWEDCKRRVDLRDKRQCRLIRCLSASEFHQIKSGTPTRIDRCHIFSRSSFPELIYNINNIISLQRFIHQRMDNYQSPITGDLISVEEHFYWWWRIFCKKIEKFNPEINYEIELIKLIKE